MNIRKMNVGDAAEAAELLRELAAAIGEDDVPDTPAIERNMRRMVDDESAYSAFIAEEEGAILGFVTAVKYRSLLHSGGTELVNELVVSSKARGKGIGKALVERIFDDARAAGMDEVEVGVMAENGDALRFYRSVGFDSECLLLGRDM
jgi:GNAT superfamily N-acetyltransferase